MEIIVNKVKFKDVVKIKSFEDNAFRKKYEDWDRTLIKPMLEIGVMAQKMRLKIIDN